MKKSNDSIQSGANKKKPVKQKRSFIDALYVKFLRDPSTNIIIMIVGFVFIIWMIIPLILVLSGAFYIPSEGETLAFSGEFTGSGQNSTRYEFDIPSWTGRIKIALETEETSEDADFDLSLWDNTGRRTGGRTISETSETEDIPDSSYNGQSKELEIITIKSPPVNETWEVSCYSYSGSGDYSILVSLQRETKGAFSFYAFKNVFTNPTFFNPAGDQSTSFFSKDITNEGGGVSTAIAFQDNIAYMAEGIAGIEVLDVSDVSDVSDSADIVDLHQYYHTDSSINDIELRDDLLYAAAGQSGLMVFDTSDIENTFPVVAELDIGANKTNFLTLDGNYAYLDNNDEGFAIIDISDPLNLSLMSIIEIEWDSSNLAIYGNYAFLVGDRSGIIVYDITDKTSPVELIRYQELDTTIDLSVQDIAIIGDEAYITLAEEGFISVDISNPLSLVLISHYDIESFSIDIFENIAYVTTENDLGLRSLMLLNISNSSNTIEISSYSYGYGAINEVYFNTETNYIYAAFGGDGLLILDTTNVVEISKVAEFQDTKEITTLHFVGVSRGSVINTVMLGLITTIISVILGTSLAFILARYEFPGKKVFSLLALAPLIIPPFISGMGFRFFLGPSGLLNNLFLLPLFDTRLVIEGFVAICFVQSFHFYALVYLNAFSSFVNVDPSMEEQAENLGAGSFRLFRTVTLPLALPGIGAGAILVLILTMEDIGTPIIFVGMGDSFARNFLTYYIFANYAQPGSSIITPEVCVMGGILLAIAIVGFFIIRKYVSLRKYSMISKGRAGQYRLSKPRWKLLFIYPYLIILYALSLIVHVGIIMMSLSETLGVTRANELKFTFQNYLLIVRDPTNQYNVPPFVINTLIYSFASVILIVILGSLAAYVVSRKEFRGKGIFDAIVTIPIAIPGIVLALGYYRAFNWTQIYERNPSAFFKFMDSLTSSLRLNPFIGIAWVLLILSYTIRKFPFTVRAAFAGLQQTDPVLEEASFNLGAGRVKTISKITVPMISLNVFAGSLVSFLYCLSEVSTTIFIILSAAGGTLTWMMAFQVSARFQIFCALGVILMLLQIFSLFVTNVILGSRTEAITGI